MADLTDGTMDPVFNNVESEVGLPIGDGEVLRAIDLEGSRAPVPEGGESTSSGGNLRQMGQVFAENKLAVVSLGVIGFMILFCFLGPHLYPTNQTNTQQALQDSVQNAPPGNGNPLGTDESGFNILGRLMFGGQASLIVGLLSALVATVFGTLFGAISGFFGGWVDDIVQYFYSTLASIPWVLLVVCFMMVFGQGLPQRRQSVSGGVCS